MTRANQYLNLGYETLHGISKLCVFNALNPANRLAQHSCTPILGQFTGTALTLIFNRRFESTAPNPRSFPENHDPAGLANLFGIRHIELHLNLRSHIFEHAKDNLVDGWSRILLVRHEVAVEQGVEHFTTNAGGVVPRLGGARYLPISVN